MPTTSDDKHTLSSVLGSWVRQWREQHPSVRQDDLVDAARAMGFEWSRSSVGELEAGRRQLSAEELVALPYLVQMAGGGLPTPGVAEIIESALGRRGQLTIGLVQIDASTTRSWLTDTSEGSVTTLPNRAAGEAERKAARKLGWTPGEVVAQSLARWGCRLSEERDRRASAVASPGASPRQLQALRGHMTRELLAELEEEMS